MDSDHRHELKDNDLYEFILNFKDFWAKHGNTIMWAVLIAASLFAAIRFYNHHQWQKHESAWSDLAASAVADGSPDVLATIAREYDDPAVKALAYLGAGDLRLNQAIKGDAADDAATKAAADYRQALSVATGPEQLLYRLNARLGLAAALEQSREWDAAREQYEKVIQEAGTRYAHLAAIAQSSVELLREVQSPVVFGPEPPTPTPAPSTGTGFGGTLEDLLGPGASPGQTDPTTGLPGLLDLSPTSPSRDPILPDLPDLPGSNDPPPAQP